MASTVYMAVVDPWIGTKGQIRHRAAFPVCAPSSHYSPSLPHMDPYCPLEMLGEHTMNAVYLAPSYQVTPLKCC